MLAGCSSFNTNQTNQVDSKIAGTRGYKLIWVMSDGSVRFRDSNSQNTKNVPKRQCCILLKTNGNQVRFTFDCKRKSHIAAENSDTKRFFCVLRSDSKFDSDKGDGRDGSLLLKLV